MCFLDDHSSCLWAKPWEDRNARCSGELETGRACVLSDVIAAVPAGRPRICHARTGSAASLHLSSLPHRPSLSVCVPDSVMLRATFSTLRPFATPGFAHAAKAPQVQTFRLYSSLRPNVLSSFKSSPLSRTTFFGQSRTFLTDAKPVVYRPTQEDAWKRFGITAVRVPRSYRLCRVAYSCRNPDHGCRNDRWRECIPEPRDARCALTC